MAKDKLQQIEQQEVTIEKQIVANQQQQQSYTLFNVVFFEFLASALFTFGVNNTYHSKISDFMAGTCLFTALIFSGRFSGGHINPAVTMGLLSKNTSISIRRANTYWLSQLLGGILGAYLGLASSGEINAPHLIFNDVENLGSILIGQFLGSFIYVFFILMIMDKKTNFCPNTIIKYSCISGALYVGRIYTQRSRGYLNPATALGMSLIFSYADPTLKAFNHTCWIFMVVPLLGGLMAGILFTKYLNELSSQLHQKKKQQQLYYEPQ